MGTGGNRVPAAAATLGTGGNYTLAIDHPAINIRVRLHPGQERRLDSSVRWGHPVEQ